MHNRGSKNIAPSIRKGKGERGIEEKGEEAREDRRKSGHDQSIHEM
jgi:hypothetical protein